MTNKIGWCDLTLNPISGCRNNCPYCYAARFAKRLAGRGGYPADDPFRPTFHPEKLDSIRKLRGKGKRVFLDSMGDWFSEGVSPAWIHRVIQVIHEKPEHYFLVLTKRPERIQKELHCVALPANLWLGVSVTCQADLWRIDAIREALPMAAHKFVSFEPLHSYIECSLHGIEWTIIGAETGNSKNKILPEQRWVSNLIDCSEAFQIPVFLKDNLRAIMPNVTPARLRLAGKQPKLRHEFPKEMF